MRIELNELRVYDNQPSLMSLRPTVNGWRLCHQIKSPADGTGH